MFVDMPPAPHIAETGNYDGSSNDNPNPIVIIGNDGQNTSLQDYYRAHSERYGSVDRLLDNAL